MNINNYLKQMKQIAHQNDLTEMEVIYESSTNKWIKKW